MKLLEFLVRRYRGLAVMALVAVGVAAPALHRLLAATFDDLTNGITPVTTDARAFILAQMLVIFGIGLLMALGTWVYFKLRGLLRNRRAGRRGR